MSVQSEELIVNATESAYSSRHLVPPPLQTAIVIPIKAAKPKKTYLCSQCGNNLKSKYNLMIHMQVHTGERLFVCHYTNCQVSRTTSQKLRQHQQNAHPGGKQYKCGFYDIKMSAFCGRQFTRTDDLKIHHWNKHNRRQKPKIIDAFKEQ
jgi:uncharacterized Zn-finger protein